MGKSKDGVVRSKITCQVTGEVMGVRPDVFDKRAEKAGGVEPMLRNYVGRKGKRLLREGKSVEEIRNELDVNDTDLTPVEDLVDVVAQITAVKKAKKAKKKVKEEPVAEGDSTAEIEDEAIKEFLSELETEDAETTEVV